MGEDGGSADVLMLISNVSLLSLSKLPLFYKSGFFIEV
ncbi:hypothetical protein BAXH7_01134 [Bacillus amyloliquefaciens XH7]|nr:hypothetical protein LL3_02491 [Bacillus amyloliquefaciens LL3]AEK88276.1 hypothetical protein BAXH7_01134 [Bacillus amyloliquefaciens XH7]KYC95755.1 hypothetical protein B425_2608 [Bacillus amyloliquefaciens]